MPKPTYAPLLVLALLFLCVSAWAQVNGDWITQGDTLIWKTQVDDTGEFGDRYHQSSIRPQVLHALPVFASPDASSTVLDTIGIGQDLKLLKWERHFTISYKYKRKGEQKIFTDTLQENHMWYMVLLENRIGYIKVAVATHTFEKEFVRYLVLPLSSTSYNPKGFAIYRYDDRIKHYTDTFHSDIYAPVVKEIANDWKNVNMLLTVEHNGACCGCSDDKWFIADVSGELKLLTQSGAYHDDGSAGSDVSSVYLPVTLSKNRTLLALDGDPSTIYNAYEGRFTNYKVPADIKVPLAQLMVYEQTTVEGLYDKEGNAVQNSDGSYKEKSETTVLKLYRWNGTELQLVKQTKTVKDLQPKAPKKKKKKA